MGELVSQLRSLISDVERTATFGTLLPLLKRYSAFFDRYQGGVHAPKWRWFIIDASEHNPITPLSNMLRQEILGFLETTLIFDQEELSSMTKQPRASQETPHISTEAGKPKIFLVHGHDATAKESAARFLEKIGVEVIILHEQPNQGRTVLEKFEAYAGTAYAVILLTPDDLGAPASNRASLTTRARQNVIFEMGYFVGRLTRSHVCVLYKPGIELPSDLSGLVYVELDDAGAWRTKLAQELVQASIPIDIKGLLKS